MTKSRFAKYDFGAILPLVALLPITGVLSGFYQAVSVSDAELTEIYLEEQVIETNLLLATNEFPTSEISTTGLVVDCKTETI